MTTNFPPRPVEALLAERLWVRALARSLVADENLADDVEQETWVAATSRPPSDDSSPRAWLGTVLRNFVRRDARGRGRRAAREIAAARDEAMPSAADMVARAEAHRSVVDAVLSLPEPYRATVLARFFEDLPPREIAKQMDVPVETVRTRLKRALVQLRERLDAQHGGDGRTWGIALLPLAVKGGLVVKTSTKTGIAAAVLLLVAGATTWWMAAPTDEPKLAAVPDSVPVVAPEPPARAAVATKEEAPVPAVPIGTASVRGEVWFTAPERPAPGVDVAIGPAGSAKTVRTDEMGRFRLASLPTGFRGAVRVRRDGSGGAVRAVPPLRAGEEFDAGMLRLAGAAAADVVVRTFDGKPVDGADVRAWRTPVSAVGLSVADTARWRDAPDPDAHAVSAGDGRVRLDGLEPGPWTFGAGKRGFAVSTSPPVPLASGAVAGPVILYAEPASPLAGRVVDRDGRAVGGVVVWAQAKSSYTYGEPLASLPHATSGADGAFAIEGLVPAVYELRAQFADSPPVVAASVRVPASGPVEVRLAGRRIAGRVREAQSGAPVAGARVTAQLASAGFSVIGATSAADGTFVLDTIVDTAHVSGIHVTKRGFVEVPDPVRTKDPNSDPGLWLRESGETALDLVMRRGARLTGRVAADGEPVRGAEVFVHRYRAAAERLVTDADGRYELDGVERGAVLVQVASEMYVQPSWSFDEAGQFWSGRKVASAVTIPDEGEVVHDVAMERGVVVSGRVLLPDGTPAVGAEVRGNNFRTTSPAADGSFRVVASIVRGRVHVYARDPLVGWGSFDAATPENRAIDGAEIRLEAAPRLTGHVTSPEPFAGAWVQWAMPPRGDAEPYWGNSSRQPVGEDGTIDIAVFASDALVLRVGAPGFATVTTTAAKRSDGSFAADVVLERSVRLAGRAVVAGTSAPVSGAEVMLLDRTKRAMDTIRTPAPQRYFGAVAAVTGADGRFVIEGLAPGTQLVRVQAAGLCAVETEVPLPAAGETAFELARGARISGRVLFSDGTPVIRASISATRPQAKPPGPGAWKDYFGFATTDEDGRYVVESLPAGTFDLLVSMGLSQAKFDNAEKKDVAGGTEGVDFTVERHAAGLVIKGRVVGEDGMAVAGASVSAMPAGGRAYGTATTQADGTFEMAGLDAVVYTVNASPPRGSMFIDVGVMLGGRWLAAKPVEATAPRDDLVITLPVGATIEGVVVDAAGAPVRNVYVAVGLPSSPDDLRGRMAGGPSADETDGDGRFEIGGLPPGVTWRLVEPGFRGVRDPAPFVGGESVKSGTRGLRLTLGAFAKISGVVVDAAGAPVSGAKVGAFGTRGEEQSATTGADGAFVLKSLQSTVRLDVVAWTMTHAPATLSAVSPGAEGLRIELREGVTVTGRVLGKDGKALQGTKLTLRTSASPVAAEASTDLEGRFTARGLLAAHYRAAYVGLVGHVYREIPCGEFDAPGEAVELRVE